MSESNDLILGAARLHLHQLEVRFDNTKDPQYDDGALYETIEELREAIETWRHLNSHL